MPELPSISGVNLVRILKKAGFRELRQKGSHVKLKHSDGRITTIPVHANKSLPKGLLRKIIRDDLLLTVSEFNEMLNR